MRDLYGREINYLRLSVTDLCNLRCKYCMPPEGVTKKDCGEILRIEDFITIARAAVELGINKIRLSGGEPLVRRGIVSLVEGIAKIDGVNDFAMTTNGILLSRYAKQLKDAGLKRLNISIDSLDSDKYREITRGGKLSDVFDGIEAAKQAGFSKIKINVVLVKNFNDDEIENFVKITKDSDIDIRFIELMPFEGQAGFALDGFLPTSEVISRCPDLTPIISDEPSSVARYYRLPNAKGRVGLIEPLSCKFCSNCNRIRVTADGHLLNCLHSREEIDLRAYLNDYKKLKDFLSLEIKRKPKSHNLDNGVYMQRDMGKIGG